MKSQVLRHISGKSALVLALAIAWAGTALAQSEEAAARSLHGTWRVQVTQFNCVTGQAVPPFWSLLSFHRGGTESETTSNPALEPGQRTSGYGFWKRAREAAFCSTNATKADYFSATEAFILSDSPTTPPGLKKGVQKILQCITMKDRDNWTSNAVVKFFNSDGTTITGCAQAEGIRLTGDTDQP